MPTGSVDRAAAGGRAREGELGRCIGRTPEPVEGHGRLRCTVIVDRHTVRDRARLSGRSTRARARGSCCSRSRKVAGSMQRAGERRPTCRPFWHLTPGPGFRPARPARTAQRRGIVRAGRVVRRPRRARRRRRRPVRDSAGVELGDQENDALDRVLPGAPDETPVRAHRPTAESSRRRPRRAVDPPRGAVGPHQTSSITTPRSQAACRERIGWLRLSRRRAGRARRCRRLPSRRRFPRRRAASYAPSPPPGPAPSGRRGRRAPTEGRGAARRRGGVARTAPGDVAAAGASARRPATAVELRRGEAASSRRGRAGGGDDSPRAGSRSGGRSSCPRSRRRRPGAATTAAGARHRLTGTLGLRRLNSPVSRSTWKPTPQDERQHGGVEDRGREQRRRNRALVIGHGRPHS